MKPDTRPGPQAKYSPHISPAIGEFAIQERPALYVEIDRLRFALSGIRDHCYQKDQAEITRLNDIYDIARNALEPVK